ncbi:NDK domain-containing protein [Caenorhabditis elegans]|uniref:NDK domain-containing protein n=1 Tax=Caenorhabditis elegans TaxID=6239 RepID=A0A3B1E9Z0_CAEEL|nr:NDK domain-containing protein [Caenorhabditis elegans]VAY52110.1 NDK domain-containing protein [Caenorhabditis elegans]|eukprot:NP_001355401.1 Uncharacterized protein CELE_ZK177.12 [Caenorhabditis elegans]
MSGAKCLLSIIPEVGSELIRQITNRMDLKYSWSGWN